MLKFKAKFSAFLVKMSIIYKNSRPVGRGGGGARGARSQKGPPDDIVKDLK